MKKALGLFLVCSLLFFSFAYAEHNPEYQSISDIDQPGIVNLDELHPDDKKLVNERTKMINSFLLDKAKMTGKKNDVEGKLSQDQLAESEYIELEEQLRILNNELTNLKHEMNEMGLVEMSDKEDNNFELQSDSTDVLYDYTEVYLDTSTGLYLFEAQAQWQNDNWSDDLECGFGTCPFEAGGEDGFLLGSIHRDISIFSNEFYTLTTDFDELRWTNSNPATDDRGIGWIYQDGLTTSSQPPAWNSFRYLGWIYFAFTDGTPVQGTTVSFQSRLGHTWEDTTLRVTGFSLGESLQVHFSNETTNYTWRQEGTTNISF